MTSRERLLCVLRGDIPDRVPVSTYELVGYDTHNFCNKEPSYKNLMDFIREKTDCICMWNPSGNEHLMASAYQPDISSRRTNLEDGYEDCVTLRISNKTLCSRQRVIDNIYTVWHTELLCKTSEDVEAILSLPYEPVSYDASDALRIESEVGQNGIIMSSISDPAGYAMALMEFGEATVWAMTETEHFASVVERLHERMMTNLERMLDAYKADLYRICGPEYLTPPYLPPQFFEKFVVPYVREMTELIHSRGSMVRLHSHGRIGRLLDMIAQTGVDGLDPCEAPPDGDIELADIKRKIGDQITLFGNIQLKMLEHGTELQVRQAVRSMMAAAKDGGRFVLMPTAAPINVPLSPHTEALYRAYIDEGLKCGQY